MRIDNLDTHMILLSCLLEWIDHVINLYFVSEYYTIISRTNRVTKLSGEHWRIFSLLRGRHFHSYQRTKKVFWILCILKRCNGEVRGWSTDRKKNYSVDALLYYLNVIALRRGNERTISRRFPIQSIMVKSVKIIIKLNFIWSVIRFTSISDFHQPITDTHDN